MYCTQCGFKLEDTDIFCAQCGKPTRPDAPPARTAPRKHLLRPMRREEDRRRVRRLRRLLRVDVTLMRILWLVAALLLGLGFIAYIVAWIAMPKDYSPAPAQAY